MDVRTIFEDNISEYSDRVDCDVAENMSRLYYRGIAGHDPDDESVLLLLIWELKSVDDETDTESELKWIYAADPSFIAPLIDSYREEALDENVRRTFLRARHLIMIKNKRL